MSVEYLKLAGSEDDRTVVAVDLKFAALPNTAAARFFDMGGTCTRSGATATRVNDQGLIEVVPADTLRIDYDPVTLECKGLLIEDARTNLWLRSAEFDNASWSKNGVTVSADAVTAPDGTQSADSVSPNGGVNSYVTQAAAATLGVTYAFSVYAKAGTGSKITFEFHSASWTGGAARFNLVNGTVESGTGTITPVGDGWYRCEASRAAAATGSLGMAIFVADTFPQGAAGANVYLWGAQRETGAFPTSYIPTTSAAVTRNADEPQVTDISGFFNATEGTMVVEAQSNAANISANQYLAEFGDGTGNERLTLYRSSTGPFMFAQDGGAIQVNSQLGTTTDGEVFRAAYAYEANDFAGSVDGAAVVTDGAGTLPTVDRLRLGVPAAASTQGLNGHLRRFTYFPKRLANATLESISADGPTVVSNAPITAARRASAGLSDIPRDTPPGLRRFLEKLKETVEVRVAQRGSPLDSSPTYRDLIDAGLISVTDGTSLTSGGRAFHVGDSTWTLNIPSWVTDNTNPPTPTGLTVSANAAGIDLVWADPTSVYTNYDRTDVYRNTSNNLTTAEFIGATSGVTYVDNLPPSGSVYYYWIRHVAKNGLQGDFNDVNGTSYINSAEVASLSSTIVGSDVLLTWSLGASNLTVQYYIIRRGDTSGTFSTATTEGVSNSTFLRTKPDFTGTQRYYVAGVDINGVIGTAATTDVTIAAPEAPTNFAGTVAGQNVVLTWTAAAAQLGVDRYELRHGASWAAGSYIAEVKGTSLTKDVDWTEGRTFWVAAYDGAENVGSAASVTVTVNVPSEPTVVFAVEGEKARLRWSESTSTLPLREYEVRYGASWATGTLLTTVTATSALVDPEWTGSRTFWVAGLDSDGNYGDAGSADGVINVASAPIVSAAASGPNVVVSWTAPTGSLPIVEYEVRHGASYGAGTFVSRVKGTSLSVVADFATTRTYWVAALDAKGNTGTAGSASISVTNPVLNSLSAEVIDNNVFLRWTSTAGTLPIGTYKVYKDDVLIGDNPALFSAIFESTSGTYVYKVVPYDTAGNAGSHLTTSAVVSQPPDFILHDSQDSDFSGTKTNAYVDSDLGVMFVNIDTSETWATHFTSRGWTTIQDQLDDGYPYYLVGKTTGSYEETVDYGATISSSKITVTPTTYFSEGGTMTVTPTISVSTDDVSYTSLGNNFSAYSTTFRYVKYKLDFTAAASGTGLATDTAVLLGVYPLTYKLDVKLKTLQGVVSCASTDASGTAVDITDEFIDVQAITLTPLATSARHATYDFVDAPNPTEFKVYLWDTSGTRQNGDVSYNIRGV